MPVAHRTEVGWGDGKRQVLPGPHTRERENLTTYMIAHYAPYATVGLLRKWMMTSIDTDQAMHIILAMAIGAIPWRGPGKFDVQVHRKGRGGWTSSCSTEYLKKHKMQTNGRRVPPPPVGPHPHGRPMPPRACSLLLCTSSLGVISFR